MKETARLRDNTYIIREMRAVHFALLVLCTGIIAMTYVPHKRIIKSYVRQIISLQTASMGKTIMEMTLQIDQGLKLELQNWNNFEVFMESFGVNVVYYKDAFVGRKI